MLMAIHCPSCNALFRLGEEMAGKKVRCQKCQHVFVVVKAEAAPSESEVAAPPPIAPAPALPNMEIDDDLDGITAEPPKAAVQPMVIDKQDPDDDEDEDVADRKKPIKPPPIKKGSNGKSSGRDRRDRRDRPPASTGSGTMIVMLLLGGFGLFACIGCAAVGAFFMAIEDVKNKPGPFVFEHQLKAKKQKMVEAAPPIADGFNDMAPPNLKKDGPPPPPPPPPPQKGALPVIFNAAGAFQTIGNLSITDPAIKVGFGTKRCRVFAAQFNVGEEYQLDLRHNLNNVDPYLVLLDDKGIILAQDDDSGGNLNSRIIHRAKYTGVHRIYVTSLNGIDTGPYSFSVRRIGFAPIGKDEPPNPK